MLLIAVEYLSWLSYFGLKAIAQLSLVVIRVALYNLESQLACMSSCYCVDICNLGGV